MSTITAPAERTAEIEHAREVDTRIAAEWDKYYDVMKNVVLEVARVQNAEKAARDYEARADQSPFNFDYYVQRAGEDWNRAARHRERAEALREDAEKFAAEARRIDAAEYTGWQRFYLVQHIHRSQFCSSFRDTTRVGWLPDVSGLTEAEAVAEHGAILCTICFPSAPVEWTRGAQADPDTCPGSGQHYDAEHLTGYEQHYYGPAGYCPSCGRWNTITRTGKMRKHKVDETRRHW